MRLESDVYLVDPSEIFAMLRAEMNQVEFRKKHIADIAAA